ncbi:MAG TPA: GNAT family N-acetyltransferase [Clostridia bacterium]|nr:GNAT family N-acetyltransferase [Clostridia bacterium]
MLLLPITPAQRTEVNRILWEQWHCPPSVSRGKAIDTTSLPGFLCTENSEILSVVTYQFENGACEIVTLNNFLENRGIGTLLMKAVAEAAKAQGCDRLWLITTNDDRNAIRFYQKKGFALVAQHVNAIEESRKLKPSIPLVGMDGIPILHEPEFELRL